MNKCFKINLRIISFIFKTLQNFAKQYWIAILVLNQSPISVVFSIVRFAGDQKTALTANRELPVQRSVFSKTLQLQNYPIAYSIQYLLLGSGCDNAALVGNGFCNDETNNPDCNFDGGDCYECQHKYLFWMCMPFDRDLCSRISSLVKTRETTLVERIFGGF